MSAILKREFKSYFITANGYIFLGVFFLLTGYFFYSTLSGGDTSTFTDIFSVIFVASMVLIPILTMRMMSEDKKLKTEQLLLTSPLKLGSLVLGKFLATFFVFCIAVAMTVVYSVVLAFFVVPAWTEILANIIGLLFLGASLIAIGEFISVFTESQMVAMVVSFVVMLFIYFINTIASYIPVEWLSNLLTTVSFMDRYYEFIYSIFSVSSMLFFVSITAIFLFLTTRVLEKRRWG